MKKSLVLVLSLFSMQVSLHGINIITQRTGKTDVYNMSMYAIRVRGFGGVFWTLIPERGKPNKFVTFQRGISDRLIIEVLWSDRLGKPILVDGKPVVKFVETFDLKDIKDKFEWIGRVDFLKGERIEGKQTDEAKLKKQTEATLTLYGKIRTYKLTEAQIRKVQNLKSYLELLQTYCGKEGKCIVKQFGEPEHKTYAVTDIKSVTGREEFKSGAGVTRITHPTEFYNASNVAISVKGLVRSYTIRPGNKESFQTGLQDTLSLEIANKGGKYTLALRNFKDQFSWLKKVTFEYPGMLTLNGLLKNDQKFGVLKEYCGGGYCSVTPEPNGTYTVSGLKLIQVQ